MASVLGPAEGILRRHWSPDRSGADLFLTPVTAPLSVLYAGGTRLRNLAYDLGVLRSRSVGLPVLSVGNLAVGGTGKTPISGWLVRLLSDRGRAPALVARGYGQDELLLHRRWAPGVPVIEAPRRVDGARQALEMGRDVVVLDDGFQHRRLGRELDLVLLSPGHPFPPRLLPRGPYREGLKALRRAHLLLVTTKGREEEAAGEELLEALRRTPGLPPAHLLPLRPGPWLDLAGSEEAPPTAPGVAVASIARPESFLALLEEVDAGPRRALVWPDHHDYTSAEVEAIARAAGGGGVVTTEKDAVKLEPFRERLPEVHVLPIRPVPGVALRAHLERELDRVLGGGGG